MLYHLILVAHALVPAPSCHAALYDGSMLIVHVHIRVKPESVEAFRQATIANARQSVKEPGIARFDLLQRPDDANSFVLVEVYRTAEAPARHRETAHYETWRDTVAEMMAEPRTRTEYANVFPGDEGW
jgi:(4S)-4-hydroxy-5-phosphonooxypentane-2,3-dione isomerase